MTDTFEYAVRPGSAALSVLSFIGLGVLTLFMWHMAPGFVLLLFIPALGACVWQVMTLPRYGIRMAPKTWHLLGIEDDFTIVVSEIAYLRVVEKRTGRKVAIVLVDGTEVRLPSECLPDVDKVISEAQARGVEVRDET